MVKIIGPLHSDHASKQLGKNVIFKTYGNRHFVTNYNKPASVKPFTPSPDQYNQRMLYNLIIARWQTLTDNQKAVYNDEAREKGLKMSGWNRFYQLAINDLPTYIGLQGYWAFNKIVSGQIRDLSGNENHGTNHGATPTTDQKGRKKGAMSFDGLNDYVAMQSFISCPSAFTALTWWKRQGDSGGISGDTYHTLINRLNGLDRNTLNIAKNGSKVTARLRYNTINYYAHKTITNINDWHLVGMIWNGINLYAIVNGVLSSPTPMAGIDSDVLPLFVGWYSINWYNSNGSIATTLIYNRALPQTELTKIYNVTKP